jgi:hypothetical protein
LGHQAEEGLVGGHDLKMVCPSGSSAAITVSPLAEAEPGSDSEVFVVIIMAYVGFFVGFGGLYHSTGFKVRVLCSLGKCLTT